jgi:hypothetical protein
LVFAAAGRLIQTAVGGQVNPDRGGRALVLWMSAFEAGWVSRKAASRVWARISMIALARP